ncbi:MAG TPA: hypothetical protein VMZ03_07140 [Chitinophagaceae bacterium]|nr:hypothetical protein [Chitinophagaceae bacterium]
MTSEQIENFFQTAKLDSSKVQISFKTRSAIVGMFIQTNDYAELKSKNLWRVVSESKIDEFNVRRDLNIARIFNGTEMTKLSLVQTSVPGKTAKSK